MNLSAKLSMGKRRYVNAADRKRRQLREQLWPGSSAWIWSINDKDMKGFATMPRLMPWILHLIKHLSEGSKSGDPSPAYLELWCRDFGQGIISISDELECAYASGYSSNRALRTWRGHIHSLIGLGFIRAAPHGNRDYGHILLLNPLAVCSKLHDEKRTPPEWWTSVCCRAAEIGATIPPASFLMRQVVDPNQDDD